MLIGIRGAIGSGKDTLAEILRQLHPTFTIYKFGGGLRLVLNLITGIASGKMVTTAHKSVVLTGEIHLGGITAANRYLGINIPVLDVAKTIATDGGRLGTVEQPYTYPPGMTLGRLMQVVGTDVYRAYDSNVWVDTLFRRLDSYGCTGIIISDVRFPNEVEAIRARGGYVVEITRPPGGPASADWVHVAGREGAHISECSLDGVTSDGRITNNGTIAELREKAAVLVAMLRLLEA